MNPYLVLGNVLPSSGTLSVQCPSWCSRYQVALQQHSPMIPPRRCLTSGPRNYMRVLALLPRFSRSRIWTGDLYPVPVCVLVLCIPTYCDLVRVSDRVSVIYLSYES